MEVSPTIEVGAGLKLGTETACVGAVTLVGSGPGGYDSILKLF